MILRSCGDGDLPIVSGVFVISICLKQGKNGLKTVIMALKILGDLKIFRQPTRSVVASPFHDVRFLSVYVTFNFDFSTLGCL